MRFNFDRETLLNGSVTQKFRNEYWAEIRAAMEQWLARRGIVMVPGDASPEDAAAMTALGLAKQRDHSKRLRDSATRPFVIAAGWWERDWFIDIVMYVHICIETADARDEQSVLDAIGFGKSLCKKHPKLTCDIAVILAECLYRVFSPRPVNEESAKARILAGRCFSEMGPVLEAEAEEQGASEIGFVARFFACVADATKIMAENLSEVEQEGDAIRAAIEEIERMSHCVAVEEGFSIMMLAVLYEFARAGWKDRCEDALVRMGRINKTGRLTELNTRALRARKQGDTRSEAAYLAEFVADHWMTPPNLEMFRLGYDSIRLTWKCTSYACSGEDHATIILNSARRVAELEELLDEPDLGGFVWEKLAMSEVAPRELVELAVERWSACNDED